MTGIYLHIPFCRKACRYCDFCFIVSLKYLDIYLAALSKEIKLRQSEVKEPVSSIYFGGGTPSVMGVQQINKLLDLLFRTFTVLPDAELTLEGNPDDLNKLYIKDLSRTDINRLSIGVQSFRAHDLQMMNRSHNENQASQAIENAAQSGIENISIDLIYGLPGLTLNAWKANVKTAFSLPVKHLSAYHLTYEKDTIFYKWLTDGRIMEIEEEDSVRQYEFLHQYAIGKGFAHYEVSNFSLPGYRSQHNSLYWSGNAYTGFGASAHSYDETGRQWNLDTVKHYIQAVELEKIWYKREELSEKDKYHDYLVTKLRTQEGIRFEEVARLFGRERVNFLKQNVRPFLDSDINEVTLTEEGITVTTQGWLRLDTVTRALMED